MAHTIRNISWYVGENVSMVTVWKHTHKDDMHVGKKYSTGMEVGEEMEVGTHVPTYPRTHVLTYHGNGEMEFPCSQLSSSVE